MAARLRPPHDGPYGLRALALAIGRGSGVPLADGLAFAEEAEAAGFGMLTIGEGPAETFSLAGALAMRTSRVELVSSTATWTRTPVTTALAAATVAELSGGRYRLGIGAMPRGWSENWHDVDYARPVDRMRDYVAAIRTAWRQRPDAPVDYEGPFYRFRAYGRNPPPPPEVPVPIYLAALRPRMTALAGEIADGVILNVQHTLDWLRDVLWPALDEGLERGGRERADLDVGILVMCVVDDDRAAAVELARPGIAYYFQLPYFADVLERYGFGADLERYRAAAAKGDARAMASAASDELVHLVALAGTAADVRAGMRRYEGLVDWVQLVGARGHSVEVTREQTRRMIEALRPDLHG